MGLLFRFYLIALLLSILLGIFWWVRFSLNLAILYRFSGILVFLIISVVLIFACLNAYHNLQNLRKEEKQIKQWAKPDED